ncbi:MAG: DUF3854 domain-containing protein [Richelia sp. SL_2_1]|nr:DUF3854 domain-containing protein [Richelia sp. SM1_7_0]NJO31377.1 DUF3854 domain-containing protein [Richelia sp. SL_2_1]
MNAIRKASPKANALTKNQQTCSQRLNDKHYFECVTERGLDPAWIEANCRTVNIDEASDLLGYTAKSGGIWLEGHNFVGQLRPDKAWRSDDKPKEKAPKYRNPLGEYDASLANNPHNPEYWEKLDELAKICYIIDGRPCLVLTEGLFKAIAGCSNEIPTISIPGVEQGLTPSKDDPQGKRFLVAILERFARASFGFILAFDADSLTNKNVCWAQLKLAHQLKKFDVPIYSVTGLWSMEEGKGMDDYIQNNGADAFRKEVLARAQTIEVWEKQFKDTSEENKIISQSSLSEQIAADYRTKIAWHVKNKAWYQYEEKIIGVWSEVSEEQVYKIISLEVKKRTQHFKWNLVSSIANFLKVELQINYWEVRSGFIALEDCVIDVNTRHTYPHEPGYRFLNSLPYKWSDRNIGCDKIKQWLLETCSGSEEWVQVIRAAMKATVTERGDLQRYMELIGYGGSGKGTILRLLTQLVGKNNIAVTDLKQLEKNRFETASFYGKKAIIITDSEQYSGDVSTLKKITGQDELRYEKKGVQQTGGFKFDGIVWVAANEAMQSKDYTSGLRRRRLSMPFNRVTPPHLRRDLEKEFKPFLPGLLAWVLEMPNNEVEEYVRNTDKKVKSLAEFNSEILLETNPVAQWADACLYVNEKAQTFIGNKTQDSSQYLFANYCRWCEENGYTPLAHIRFSKTLVELFQTHLGNLEVTRHRSNKGTYIKGISLKLPGFQHLPRPITGDLLETVTVSDGSSDGLVTDKVTVENPASDGFEQSDGYLRENQYENSRHQVVDDDPSKTAENAGKASQPSKSTTAGNTSHHETVTPGNTNCHEPSSESSENQSLGSKIVACWDDQYALGKLVLSIRTSELIAETANYTNVQIKHIKDAANRAWQVGLNRDADYNGERVEIMEARSGSREIKVRTQGGSLLKVKRGNLRPWLGL